MATSTGQTSGAAIAYIQIIEGDLIEIMPPPECSACFCEAQGRRAHLGDDIVCRPCFAQIFELAIQDEAEYPAHWGSQQLGIDVCWKMLSADLVSRYKAAGREYGTPPADRVYCKRTDPPRRPEPCHAFIGAWRNRKECVRCDKCMWYTCLRCEESYSTGDALGEVATIEHDCDPQRDNDIRYRALRGLIRGRDYQICPSGSCGRVWSLHDGCNHLICPSCKTHFCFVCGKQVEDGRGHWRSNGGCPRWNFPGDDNAHFDDADEWNDNDPEVEQFEEAARRIQQEPGVVIDEMLLQAIGPAVSQGRVLLMIDDREVLEMLSGLTMALDISNGARIIFRNRDGEIVNPLEGLDQARMPRLIVRPQRAHRVRRRGMYRLPDLINDLILRIWNRRRANAERREREMWRE